MAKKSNARYVVARLDDNDQNRTFSVRKYIGTGTVMDEMYVVTVSPNIQRDLDGTVWSDEPIYICNCPNSRSGRHINDKHGRMVDDWIKRGEPTKGYYDSDGVHHG